MKRIGDPTLWAGIMIPLFVLLILGIYPRPISAEQGLRAAREAADRGDSAKAAAAYERAAESQPWRGDLWVEAAKLAYQAGDDSAALRDYQRAAAAGQLSSERWLEYGGAAQRSGDIRAALAIWRDALVRNGPTTALFERIEQADRIIGDEQALIADLRVHLAFDPSDAQAAFLLGQVLSIRQPADAVKWARQAKAADATFTGRANRLEAGVALETRISDLSNRYLSAGRTLGSLEAWDLASWAFQAAVEANANNAEAWAFLGEAKQQLKQDGATDLSKAMALNPNSALVQALQAIYWQRQGKPERALVHLHAVADEEPDNPIWQVELGNALTGMGNQTEALSYYLKAVELAPDNAGYWKTLAAFSVQYNVRLREIGLEAARQAVAIQPEDVAGLDLMGQILIGLGDMTSAERFLLRAVQAAGNDATAQFHLGNLYLMTGKMEAAYDHLRLASNLQPDQGAGLQAERLLNSYFPQ